MEIRENVIEWITGSNTVTVTISQKRHQSKIRRLAEKHPDDVDILTDNNGDCIVAHIPLKYIHIFASESHLTEEQRKANGERLKKLRQTKSEK